jgi:ABC-type transporter Mla subunit MlaD
MNGDLQRALAALYAGAAELRDTSSRSTAEIRAVLRQTAEEILDRLEQQESDAPEDIFSTLDRQSKSIADDLRRAERLMRERSEGP